jgi:hypothetical protein
VYRLEEVKETNNYMVKVGYCAKPKKYFKLFLDCNRYRNRLRERLHKKLIFRLLRDIF